jgi:hypothetical protein
MALGIVLLDLTQGYHAGLMRYLFGSILAVPVSELRMMPACQTAVGSVVGYFYCNHRSKTGRTTGRASRPEKPIDLNLLRVIMG